MTKVKTLLSHLGLYGILSGLLIILELVSFLENVHFFPPSF